MNIFHVEAPGLKLLQVNEVNEPSALLRNNGIPIKYMTIQDSDSTEIHCGSAHVVCLLGTYLTVCTSLICDYSIMHFLHL